MSARNTLAWARGLYRAAREPRGAASTARLEHAQWLCASAEACVGEAQRLYLDSLESLLRTGISVQRQEQAGLVGFACRPLDGPATDLLLFEDGHARPAEPALLERLFGGAGEDLLDAFGQGLNRLDALGMFAGAAPLHLRPDPPARTPRQDLAELPRRRPGAASRHFRNQPAAPPPPLPLRPI
jgi:hypothetical protein